MMKEKVGEGLKTENQRTSKFYLWPKICKSGKPPCPVFSSANCHTSNISKYMDYHLQPIVKETPSYVRVFPTAGGWGWEGRKSPPTSRKFAHFLSPPNSKFSKSQIQSRAAKVSVKYCTWFHVRNLDNDTVTSIDWKTTRKSKPISNEKVLLSSHKNIPSSDMIKAKLDERQNLSFWGLPGLILRYAYIFEIMIIFLVFLTKKYNNK